MISLKTSQQDRKSSPWGSLTWLCVKQGMKIGNFEDFYLGKSEHPGNKHQTQTNKKQLPPVFCLKSTKRNQQKRNEQQDNLEQVPSFMPISPAST